MSTGTIERETASPWTWQEPLGFVQAHSVSGGGRTIYCAGQTSVEAEGVPVHEDDMAAQVTQALDNLETVLSQNGAGLADVVRLTYYVTDVDAFFGAQAMLTERLGAAGCRPVATLLGVQRLAFPQLLVEIEATAVV